MAFDKITNQDRAGKGNVGQPDTPALTTADMQIQMDSLPNLAIDKFNEFIDKINAASTGAINIGATVPPGIGVTAQNNIQSVLNAMATNLALNTQARHSHANKAALDGITQSELDEYNRIAALLNTILSVQTSIIDDDKALATAGAVFDYVNNFDMRQKILATAWPVGSVYSSRGTSPTAVFGGSWNVLDTDSKNVTRYIRVS
jgi:hypothetical protein